MTAASTVAGLGTEIVGSDETLIFPDTIRDLVDFVHSSRSPREKVAALKSLAILMTNSEGYIINTIANENGEEVFIGILGQGEFLLHCQASLHVCCFLINRFHLTSAAGSINTCRCALQAQWLRLWQLPGLLETYGDHKSIAAEYATQTH